MLRRGDPNDDLEAERPGVPGDRPGVVGVLRPGVVGVVARSLLGDALGELRACLGDDLPSLCRLKSCNDDPACPGSASIAAAIAAAGAPATGGWNRRRCCVASIAAACSAATCAATASFAAAAAAATVDEDNAAFAAPAVAAAFAVERAVRFPCDAFGGRNGIPPTGGVSFGTRPKAAALPAGNASAGGGCLLDAKLLMEATWSSLMEDSLPGDPGFRVSVTTRFSRPSLAWQLTHPSGVESLSLATCARLVPSGNSP